MSRKVKKKNLDFEMMFYEGVLAKSPDFIEALMALGDVYTKKGMYEKGLEIDQRLAQLRPDDPYVLYNLACSYSLLSDIDRSFRSIKQAVKYGYDDFPHLQADADLENLKSDPKFQRYFSKLLGKRSPAS